MKPVIYKGVEIGKTEEDSHGFYYFMDASMGVKYKNEAKAEAACIEAARSEWERLDKAFGSCDDCRYPGEY